MPKVKRIRSAALAGNKSRHAPLGQVIQEDENRGKYAASTRTRGKKKDKKDDDKELMDERTSKQILELSREQQMEMEREEVQRLQRKANHMKTDIESDEDDEGDDDDESVPLNDDDYVQSDAGYVTMVDGDDALSPEEEAVVASMMADRGEERKTLADIILQKIQEKEMEKRGEYPEEDEQGGVALPEMVIRVYTDIGKVLSRYTAGKLPKAFKVIPSLTNWEEVLYLTRPDLWTPQAMYAATRIFASNLNPKMAQRFYNLILLDSVRADIVSEKKLNYHYYISLKKAVYKPAAFFKGILLPLCMDHCTLREAAIVASVLQRVSIPVHHAAVAIHKLAQLEYSGAASIFIKTLLNKKYALPAPVIRSLVVHFTAFTNDVRVLPVLWHQALLVFVQRYKNEIKDVAREGLRVVMKKHFHPKITPEIRRELFGAQAWKEERAAASSGGVSNMIQ